MGILCGGDDLRLVDIAVNSSVMPSILNSFLIFFQSTGCQLRNNLHRVRRQSFKFDICVTVHH